jgi:hypothetical protein
MKLLIAKGISNILSALAVVVESTFILAYLGTNNLRSALAWTVVAGVIILLLLIVVYYFVRKGKFSDLDVSTQQQRPLLFLLDFIFAAIYFSVLYILHAPRTLFLGNIAVFLAVAVLVIINKFIKSSVHMAILSGALTLFVLLGGTVYLWGFILIPILAWARLATKRHTLNEVITGTVLGVLVSGATFLIFQILLSPK